MNEPTGSPSDGGGDAEAHLAERLVDALVATGRGTIVSSRSRRYITLERPDVWFFYVGPAGALRFGKTVTGSMAASHDFKRRLLEETERYKAQNDRRRRAT